MPLVLTKQDSLMVLALMKQGSLMAPVLSWQELKHCKMVWCWMEDRSGNRRSEHQLSSQTERSCQA